MKNIVPMVLPALALLLWTSAGQAAPVQNNAQQSVQLTQAQLRAMLDNMGYSYRALPQKNGSTSFEISLLHDGFTYPVMVEISPGHANIWVFVKLAKLGPPSMATEQRLEQMLEKSYEFMPVFFSINPKDRVLCLLERIDNDNVTPARLRSEIDTVVTRVNETRNLWLPPRAPAPAARITTEAMPAAK